MNAAVSFSRSSVERPIALSLIDLLCLLNPASSQRVVRDAKLPCYLGEAPVRRGAENKSEGFSFEFFWRVSWCCSRH